MSASRRSKSRASDETRLFADDQTEGAKSITAVKPLERDPNMRSIIVGRRSVATLRVGDVGALGIEVGQQWTPALADRVARAVQAEKARKAAMRLLSGRGFSRRELESRLVRRGHNAEIASEVVSQAVADGWLDERAYAQEIVRAASRTKPAGKRLLQEKLDRRQLDPDMANAALNAAMPGRSERQAAVELAKQRLAGMGKLDPAAAQRRIAGLLARRGFDEDDIAAAIDALRLEVRSSSRQNE